MTRCHSASSISSKRAARPTPATLMSMCNPPNRATAVPIDARTDSMLGDVADAAVDRAARGADGTDRFVQAFLADVDGKHLGALRGKQRRRGAADTGRGPGDVSDAIGETFIWHVISAGE